MKEKEIWHKIDIEGTNYENYSVSNFGRIKNNKKDLILKQSKTSMGYLTVVLYNKNAISIRNSGKKIAVHRLVALYFVNGDTSLIVNHIDGNKENNHYKNLEWVTHSENNKHAYRLGLKSEYGENNPSNKYSEKNIRKICKMLEKDNTLTNKEISLLVFKEYNSKLSNLIGHIKRKDRWKEVIKDYNF